MVGVAATDFLDTQQRDTKDSSEQTPHGTPEHESEKNGHWRHVQQLAKHDWLKGVAHVALHDTRTDESSDLLPHFEIVVYQNNGHWQEHRDHGADIGDVVEQERQQTEHDSQLNLQSEEDRSDDGSS